MKGRAYQWDADNRLVKISPKAGNSGATTTLQYDGVGRYTKITTTNGGITNERRFLWCGDELCQSRTASDNVQEHFYEEGIHTLIAGHESTYAIKDHLGSVHKNIGINSQSVYASFYYNPYGAFYRSSQTGTNLDEFRYAGMFYLPEAELYFTRYRAYDASTGHWLSRDPIAEQGGINLYGYVEGNPVNFNDPLGLEAEGNHKLDAQQVQTIKEKLSDPNLSKKERNELKQKLKKHEKAIGERPSRKSKDKIKTPRVIPLVIWDILQEECRMGLINIGCLPENTPENPFMCKL